jgi:REP element-mobilizing transposase RayT
VPRRARLAIAGIPWHIIQRGNNRCACFFHEEDYRFYLEQLSTQAQKFGCLVHAYCLMTNHVHLLLTPHEKDSASLLMKHLGQRYVQFINRTYRRSGTLWEGRFKSCLTQEKRLNNYRELIEERIDEQQWGAIRGATNGNYVLGNTGFQKKIEITLGRRTRLGRPSRPIQM